jgi:hypothetical protein
MTLNEVAAHTNQRLSIPCSTSYWQLAALFAWRIFTGFPNTSVYFLILFVPINTNASLHVVQTGT